MRRRIRSAFNALLGLSANRWTGWRWTVECDPSAWRCSRCGGELVTVTPPSRPMIHMCTPELREGERMSVSYIGVRAHAGRVWAVIRENRPRLVRGKPQPVHAHFSRHEPIHWEIDIPANRDVSG